MSVQQYNNLRFHYSDDQYNIFNIYIYALTRVFTQLLQAFDIGVYC